VRAPRLARRRSSRTAGSKSSRATTAAASASDSFGGAAASITHAKRRKLLATARYYMKCHGAREVPCRFDVVLLTGVEPRIEWIEDAFGE
jgi:Holliday junction resolvase-like predicted endonuclease